MATKKSKPKAPAKKPVAKKVPAKKAVAAKASTPAASGSLGSIIKSSYLKRMGG